ncbi:MAG: FixH family protein [Bacillus sp. (in: firmicutes)]
MLKKSLHYMLLGLVLLLLSSCGTPGENWVVDFTEPLRYTKGAETQIEVKIIEENEPVADVSVRAHFEMSSMSHGSVDIKLEEQGEGIYSGKAEFPMAGKYTATFTLKKEGYTVEKIVDVEVEKVEGVATINGEPINSDDLEFYKFINELHIAINREDDKKKFSGAELEQRMAHWDDQQQQIQNNNQLLTQIIRLRAMALLGKEKGYTASDAEINKEVEAIRDKYYQSEVAKDMINKFGEDKFWSKEQKQYEYIVLTQKVQKDVTEKVKKENPNVGEQEINFLAQKD